MQQEPSVDAAEWERRGIDADTAGRHAEAEACFTKAVASDPGRSISWVGLAFSQINQKRTADAVASLQRAKRSEEHTSELQSLMRISYAVLCLKKKNNHKTHKDGLETMQDNT